MAAPDYTLPGNDPGHVLLIRRNGRDNLVAVRFDLHHRNRDYWVRSAYVLSEGKLERIFDAIRRQGGTPELLAVARLPEAPGQAQPPSPHSDSPADRLIKIARGEIASNPPSGGDAKYSLFVLKKLRSQAPVDPTQTAGTPARPTIANAATADDGLQKFLSWIYSGGQITDPKQLEEEQSEERQAIVMALLQIAANAGQAKTIGETLSGVASGAASGFGEYKNQKKARRDEQQQEFGNRVGLGKLFFDAEGARATREANIEDRRARLAQQAGYYQEIQRRNQATEGQAASEAARKVADDRNDRLKAEREAGIKERPKPKLLSEYEMDLRKNDPVLALNPKKLQAEARRLQQLDAGGGAGAAGQGATGGGRKLIQNPKTKQWYAEDPNGNLVKVEAPKPGA